MSDRKLQDRYGAANGSPSLNKLHKDTMMLSSLDIVSSGIHHLPTKTPKYAQVPMAEKQPQ